MTHLWIDGANVTVTTLPDRDTWPGSFVWNGTLYSISSICNCWRVHADWWQQEIRRDYFKVQTDVGLLCIIYHDLIAGNWYLVKTYD